jgi:hypothetical protein
MTPGALHIRNKSCCPPLLIDFLTFSDELNSFPPVLAEA